mmetsp:Transcript_38882/g.90461  ORF Transcript_38882/g.90461 Transcript_38882/m.90461 type:complete len:122 (+) Transcript_38882:517-882(+)
MFSEYELARGNTCAQLFVTAEGFIYGHPLKSKGNTWESLNKFCWEVGVPKTLISDRAQEELHGDLEQVVKENLVNQRTTEPYSRWQNRCEDEIRKLRKYHRRIMKLHRAPEAFWCLLGSTQ